jgi:hypothetical protein
MQLLEYPESLAHHAVGPQEIAVVIRIDLLHL